MKTLLSILAFVLLSVAAPAATNYYLTWDASPPAESVIKYIVEKKTGTTWTLVAATTATTLKQILVGAVPGDVYSVRAENLAGKGERAEATVLALPAKVNVRVVIEITP